MVVIKLSWPDRSEELCLGLFFVVRRTPNSQMTKRGTWKNYYDIDFDQEIIYILDSKSGKWGSSKSSMELKRNNEQS